MIHSVKNTLHFFSSAPSISLTWSKLPTISNKPLHVTGWQSLTHIHSRHNEYQYLYQHVSTRSHSQQLNLAALWPLSFKLWCSTFQLLVLDVSGSAVKVAVIHFMQQLDRCFKIKDLQSGSQHWATYNIKLHFQNKACQMLRMLLLLSSSCSLVRFTQQTYLV